MDVSAMAMDDSGTARKGPGVARDGSAGAMRARRWRGRADKEQPGGAQGGSDGDDDPTTSYPLMSQTKKWLVPRTKPNRENGYP
jgi:hypothetical protein